MINYRIGQGYDIHRFSPGRKLILGGVNIEYPAGLEGHSDADVICHAVMDALLGAVSLGDIGTHFPNNDPAYKNADSLKLLAQVGQLIGRGGYSISNIDITVIAEQPKIMPYSANMRMNIANTLKIDKDCVSVKATTNEKIGLIGKGEGIAAFAVALLYK
jgi:2-C-methyl-D-erythritol 2,4-cyclodiphosphate synthase